jgi:Ca2+-binding EF-hand superfamily protein
LWSLCGFVAEVERIFRDIDFDHTGKIYYHEFLASTISRQAITEENVKIAFEKISNHNDVITVTDLRNLLGVDASWKSVRAYVRESERRKMLYINRLRT